MLPELGQVLDEKYAIEGRLGHGGMAVVFAAHHTVLDRPVALKFLSPDLPRTPQLVERFLAEARAAARIDSVHVARVFDAGTLDDGLPFIVMERLEGCDLAELLEVHKQLPIGDAVDYVLQVLQGLAHAHVLGVVHRDLKPANLFLTSLPDGGTLIKILDFGIAKLVDEARLIARGETETMGSPMYMSPEQVRDAELVDARADLWSIGVVLYELVTGRTPFEVDAVGGDTFAAVLGHTPAAPSTLRAELPPELDAAILRCLEQEPTRRFADVEELAAAIAPFGTGAYLPLVEAIEATLRQPPRRGTASHSVSRPAAKTARAVAPARVAFTDDDAAVALYGDATRSSLDTTFFTLLGDMLDFVAVALSFEEIIARGREDLVRLPAEAAMEIERLEKLARVTKDAIEGATTGDPETPSARVGAATLLKLESAVASEISKIEATRDAELNEVPVKERAARDACVKACEALLLRHDLPGAAVDLVLRRNEDGRYDATLTGAVDYGLEWRIALEIPQRHALARVARLEKLARIEVQAPELTGWLRKEVKLRPQRLDRLWLTELTLAGTKRMTLRLSAEADGGGDEGFDLEVDRPASTFRLTRRVEGSDAPPAPYELDAADAAKVTALHRTLLGVARELASSRRRLVEATLDKAPLLEGHDPRVVVERLVGSLAPIVHEIALRSPSPTELALKRLTADDRREEVFVSKAMLLDKLARVPERLRKLLAPLAIALDSTGVRASLPSYSRGS